jgi:hypothetical protein
MVKKLKFVRESLLEFERGLDPKEAMGSGIIARMRADLEKIGYERDDYEILPDLTIKTKKTGYYWADHKLELIALKYKFPEQYEFVQEIYEEKRSTRDIDVKAAIDKALKNNISREDIGILLYKWADSKVRSEGNIYLSKQTRKKEDKEYDEEFNIYAFIGFTEKVPVKGTKYFEDKLGTETILKIDKFKMADLLSINAMKTRARIQYPDGQVYKVHIPPD